MGSQDVSNFIAIVSALLSCVGLIVYVKSVETPLRTRKSEIYAYVPQGSTHSRCVCDHCVRGVFMSKY